MEHKHKCHDKTKNVYVFHRGSSIVQSFSTPGSGIFTFPAGVTNFTAKLWGGGGAGGSITTAGTASGGGGSGALTEATIVLPPGVTSITYTVGSASTGSNNATPSTLTVLSTTLTANAGSDGIVASGATALGGAGGGSSSVVTSGLILGGYSIAGQNGGPGFAGGTYFGTGGGGGGAPEGGAGGQGFSLGYDVTGVSTSLTPGSIPGGGGAGGFNIFTNSVVSSSGANGLILIYY